MGTFAEGAELPPEQRVEYVKTNLALEVRTLPASVERDTSTRAMAEPLLPVLLLFGTFILVSLLGSSLSASLSGRIALAVFLGASGVLQLMAGAGGAGGISADAGGILFQAKAQADAKILLAVLVLVPGISRIAGAVIAAGLLGAAGLPVYEMATGSASAGSATDVGLAAGPNAVAFLWTLGFAIRNPGAESS